MFLLVEYGTMKAQKMNQKDGKACLKSNNHDNVKTMRTMQRMMGLQMLQLTMYMKCIEDEGVKRRQIKESQTNSRY